MSVSRYFYDPFYTVDDFSPLFNEGRTSGSRRHAGADNAHPVTKPFSPRMDVHEDSESGLMTATFELPGMKKEDVTIDVHNDHLIISGSANTEVEEKKEGYTVRERRSGKFSRTLPLPSGTTPKDIGAKMEDGLLSVTFPKTHPEKAPARITIS